MTEPMPITDVVERTNAALENLRNAQDLYRGCGEAVNGANMAAAELAEVVPELVAETALLRALLRQVWELATKYTPSPDVVQDIAELISAAVADQGADKAMSERKCVHTPELRERRHYDPAVIPADAWVCAECETFLGRAAAVVRVGEEPR